MENSNEKLLVILYSNAKLCIQSINELIPRIQNDLLLQELSKQESLYQLVAKECIMIAASENFDVKESFWFDSGKLWSHLPCSSTDVESASYFAEKVYLGTLMEMIEIIGGLSECKDADLEILKLGKKLHAIAQENVENMKRFLVH